MMERLAAEVTRLCELQPALPVVVVQDGAPELHRLIDEWSENYHIPIAMRLIDRFHVDERLAGAAEILEPDRVKRWALEATWRRSIARSDLAIARICEGFRRLVRDVWHADDGGEDFFPRPPKSVASMHGPAAQILDGHVTYFDNATGRFAYASARRPGLPHRQRRHGRRVQVGRHRAVQRVGATLARIGTLTLPACTNPLSQ